MLKPEFADATEHDLTRRNLEHDLIVYICRKARGIGETGAGAIAEYIDTISEFNAAIAETFLEVKRKSGKPLLQPEQAEAIIEQRNHFLPAAATDIRHMWITALIRDFVERVIAEIKSTDFDQLLINPFLIRAFNFTDHKEVITFCFYQKVTRSIVTSWGFTVERMLFVSGGELITDAKGKVIKNGFDLHVERDGIDYNFQIKSSPNTMDFDQVRFLNSKIKDLQETEGKIGMLGVTYGVKESHLSSIMQGVDGYPDKVFVGHELWDFIADEKGYTQKVLDWASEGMPNNTNFTTLLDETHAALVKTWEASYGTGATSITKVLERYV